VRTLFALSLACAASLAAAPPAHADRPPVFGGVHRVPRPSDDAREGAHGAVELPAGLAPHAVDATTAYPTYGWPLPYPLHDSLLIVNYVDLDPTAGLLDYSGGAHTYDGHRGTDISLYDFRAMDRGARILAAAPGTVYRLSPLAPGAFDRHCLFDAVDDGNWVQLDDGDGSYTYYLHMRANSMTVQVGDAVQTGQVLGLVGSSGYATFPHIHFEPGDYAGGPYVARDPFHGSSNPLPSQWQVQPAYQGSVPLWFTQLGVFTEAQVGGSVFNTDWCAIMEHPIQPVQIGIHETHLPMWFQSQGNLGDTYRIELRRPDDSVWAAFDDTLRYDARIDWFWAYYFWDGGVTSADYGTWTLRAYANGTLSNQAPFVVGPTTVYPPRVAPGVSRSFRIDGSVQRDTLRVSRFSAPVTWSLLGAPPFVTLSDSVLTVAASSSQATRSTFFEAVATDGAARRDTAWFHVVDMSKPLEQTVAVVSGPPAGELGLALGSGNPSRGPVTLRLALPRAGVARLEFYDITGRRVRRLMNHDCAAGELRLSWDGRDDAGRTLPAGVFLARLSQGDASCGLKLLLLR
jgi:murein DD-endopeptidase MepM/ murein hydrolase activator NlpD